MIKSSKLEIGNEITLARYGSDPLYECAEFISVFKWKAEKRFHLQIATIDACNHCGKLCYICLDKDICCECYRQHKKIHRIGKCGICALKKNVT